MNTYEWFYSAIDDPFLSTDETITELYHRVQLEELPLIIYKNIHNKNRWFVSLDERSQGKTIFAGFHFAKDFKYVEQATQWARTQFGSGQDIKVTYVGPLNLVKE